MITVLIIVLLIIILFWSGIFDSFLYKENSSNDNKNIERNTEKISPQFENYHSSSLTKKEKAIIILGMFYIAYEDDGEVDEQEKFAIEFNTSLLGLSIEEFNIIIKDLKANDDKELFVQLKNVSLENKKFITRAFHSVANTSPIALDKKAPLMLQILEDIGVNIEKITDYLEF